MEHFKYSNNVQIEKRKLNLVQRSALHMYYKKENVLAHGMRLKQ